MQIINTKCPKKKLRQVLESLGKHYYGKWRTELWIYNKSKNKLSVFFL